MCPFTKNVHTVLHILFFNEYNYLSNFVSRESIVADVPRIHRSTYHGVVLVSSYIIKYPGQVQRTVLSCVRGEKVECISRDMRAAKNKVSFCVLSNATSGQIIVGENGKDYSPPKTQSVTK